MKSRNFWPLLLPAFLLGFIFLFTAFAEWISSSNNSATACPIKKLTGFYCPGCGGTRCAKSITDGEILAALSYNPMLAIGFFSLLAASIFIIVRKTILGQPSPKITDVQPRWLWLGIAGIILFTILRNIPVYPFTILAP